MIAASRPESRSTCLRFRSDLSVVDCSVKKAHTHLITRIYNMKHKATFRSIACFHGLSKDGLINWGSLFILYMCMGFFCCLIFLFFKESVFQSPWTYLWSYIPKLVFTQKWAIFFSFSFFRAVVCVCVHVCMCVRAHAQVLYISYRELSVVRCPIRW